MTTATFLFLFFCFSVLTATAQSGTLEKNKVMDYFQNQQFDDAINYLLPLANDDSNNIDLLGYLGYDNFMNDEIGASEKYFQKIFAIDTNNIDAIQYLSNIYSRQKPRQALALAYRLINLKPAKSSYYRQAGDLFRKLNEKDSALIYYQFAYSLAPKDVKNEISLADMLIDLKRFSGGDSILDPGLITDSVNTRFLELRIKSAYEAKDYQSAVVPGERLMKIEGVFFNALTQLTLSYYFLKKYDDCIRVCNYLENCGVYSESLFYYKAKAWSKLKNYEKSNELLTQCVQMAISKAAESYYYALGENYEFLGKFKKAINHYDTAFYLFKNPVMEYNCGRIAETNMKNNTLAKKYYMKYLSVAKPESADEKKAYAYVKSKWNSQKTKPESKHGTNQ
jgi:tetratricopeptide (TPR) repeat protein